MQSLASLQSHVLMQTCCGLWAGLRWAWKLVGMGLEMGWDGLENRMGWAWKCAWDGLGMDSLFLSVLTAPANKIRNWFEGQWSQWIPVVLLFWMPRAWHPTLLYLHALASSCCIPFEFVKVWSIVENCRFRVFCKELPFSVYLFFVRGNLFYKKQ